MCFLPFHPLPTLWGPTFSAQPCCQPWDPASPRDAMVIFYGFWRFEVSLSQQVWQLDEAKVTRFVIGLGLAGSMQGGDFFLDALVLGFQS